MSKSVFARLIITIKAEDDDINDHFEEVEDEFNDLYITLDEIVGSDKYQLISLSIKDE